MVGAVSDVKPTVETKYLCEALGLPRASYYRWVKPDAGSGEHKPRPAPPRALSPKEREEMLAVLHSPRFVDTAPSAVYATLLDEDKYICSIRTMYRLLDDCNEVRERRNQARHPEYKKPELLATAPNQVWSWDITKLRGPEKWHYYYLYVIMDIFSRYVVGWMVAQRETADLSRRLIRETCRQQQVDPGQLTLHSDRGSPMTAKTTAQLLADLGVTKSHSRPHVSDDNPFSESHFKTMKYRPDFPDRFGSPEDSRGFCQHFFAWYNNDHRHSGIGLLTPATVHSGLAPAINLRRQDTLTAAYQAHPERFVRKAPAPPALTTAVWINPPKQGGDLH